MDIKNKPSFSMGGIVTPRKPHACGGQSWEIVRTGADYKLKCLTCGRYVMVSYDKLVKMTKSYAPKKESIDEKSRTIF